MPDSSAPRPTSHAPGPPPHAPRTARAASAAFQARARAAIADTRLAQALSITTTRLADGRTRAMGSLPNADAVRDRARQIRAHSIAHLDQYLEQFVSEAERRGCEVHWADTAEAACRIVIDIAHRERISLAVKSKSMVSEEIALNAAMDAAGIRVVETDLGEFVVQVAEDRPSHIIAPIVHWRREDVARLFREKLGASEDDVRDVPAITAFARRTLRESFLRAGMGISGVNMAVAESGSLCLVTNEGNGRLTTSAPRVHVALLGLERIVPTAADLGVVLQVLARSATGQALSVYTSFMTGPRRHPATGRAADASRLAEPDGPDQLHIVIVDNGRSRLLGTALAEILYCIRCGACLNICPVYRHIGGHAYDSVYPGPVGSVVTPGLFGVETAAELPHASSLCGACRDVCPVRIDLPHLLLELRAETARRGMGPFWLRAGIALFAAIATRPALYRAAGRMAGRVASVWARNGQLTRLPGPLAGWTATRNLRAPVTRSFVERWHAGRRGNGSAT
jgi:L-lactate dehydrogenase complex protein LldF